MIQTRVLSSLFEFFCTEKQKYCENSEYDCVQVCVCVWHERVSAWSAPPRSSHLKSAESYKFHGRICFNYTVVFFFELVNEKGHSHMSVKSTSQILKHLRSKCISCNTFRGRKKTLLRFFWGNHSKFPFYFNHISFQHTFRSFFSFFSTAFLNRSRWQLIICFWNCCKLIQNAWILCSFLFFSHFTEHSVCSTFCCLFGVWKSARNSVDFTVFQHLQIVRFGCLFWFYFAWCDAISSVLFFSCGVSDDDDDGDISSQYTLFITYTHVSLPLSLGSKTKIYDFFEQMFASFPCTFESIKCGLECDVMCWTRLFSLQTQTHTHTLGLLENVRI